MPRQRPTAVFVLGILNIVFGGLGAACFLCAGFTELFLTGLHSSVAPEKGEEFNPTLALHEALPNYGSIVAGTAILLILVYVLLLACGTGLLKMRAWARWGSVCCAVVMIVAVVGSLIYDLAYVRPVVAELQREASERMAPRTGGGTAVPPVAQEHAVLKAGGGVLGAVAQVGYAIALLIVLFLPHVGDAFAGRDRPGLGDPGYEDYDEDDE